jgi:hypothetical protein
MRIHSNKATVVALRDSDRLGLQLRPPGHFGSDVERIHVDVKDAAARSHDICPSGSRQ